jgi:hypothetical protein
VSADSGPTSDVSRNAEDGTPRRVSNAVSSPITRPVISSIPASTTCCASRLESSTSNVGSPPRSASASTVVSSRPSAPSRRSVVAAV